MNEIDRDALQRAFDTARRNPAGRKRIDAWLDDGRSREDAAKSCACLCQSIALDLMPWQLPPVSPTIANHLDDVLREPFNESGRREAGEVLRKLSALGLSIYEPDPIAAIVAAEQRQAAS